MKQWALCVCIRVYSCVNLFPKHVLVSIHSVIMIIIVIVIIIIVIIMMIVIIVIVVIIISKK